MFGVIYKITNPNGKVYIGQTIDFERRMRQYSVYNNNQQTALFASFLKYGWENHEVEILEICEEEELNLKEQQWIIAYDSYKSGLNCTGGGDFTNYNKLEEVKAKLSKKVHCYTIFGYYFRSFNSRTEASIWASGSKQPGMINEVCKGKRQTAFGCRWSNNLVKKLPMLPPKKNLIDNLKGKNRWS